MGTEFQHVRSRVVVVSPNSQNAFGAALADAALTHRPRVDAQSFPDLGKAYFGDGDWGNTLHDYPTLRVATEQATGIQFTAIPTDYMAPWLWAQILNSVVTTGAGSPYSHVFKPLNSTRQAKVTTIYIEDTAAIKTKYPDLAGTELSFNFGPSGPMQAQLNMVGSGKYTDGAMVGGPPAPVANPVVLLGSDTDYLVGAQGAAVSIKSLVRSATVKVTRELEVYRAPGGGLYAVQLNVNKTRASVSLVVRAKDTEVAGDPRSIFLGETLRELQINTNSGAAAQMNIKFPALKFRTKPVQDGMFVGWQMDATEDDVFKDGNNEIIEVTCLSGQDAFLVGA